MAVIKYSPSLNGFVYTNTNDPADLKYPTDNNGNGIVNDWIDLLADSSDADKVERYYEILLEAQRLGVSVFSGSEFTSKDPRTAADKDSNTNYPVEIYSVNSDGGRPGVRRRQSDEQTSGAGAGVGGGNLQSGTVRAIWVGRTTTTNITTDHSVNIDSVDDLGRGRYRFNFAANLMEDQYYASAFTMSYNQVAPDLGHGEARTVTQNAGSHTVYVHAELAGSRYLDKDILTGIWTK